MGEKAFHRELETGQEKFPFYRSFQYKWSVISSKMDWISTRVQLVLRPGLIVRRDFNFLDIRVL